MMYSKNLGTIVVGKTQTIIFDLEKEIQPVKDGMGRPKIIKSCGCITVNLKGKQLVVNFTPKEIPKHLAAQNFYTTAKKITLYYIENSGQKEMYFMLTAKVINKK